MHSYQTHFEHKLDLYRQAMTYAGVDTILIDSGSAAVAYRDDLQYPYKANPYFKEWLPIDQNQNAFLSIGLTTQPALYIHRPKDYWHSSPVRLDDSVLRYFEVIEYCEVAEISGLANVVYIGELSVDSNPHLKLTGSSSKQQNAERLINYIDYHRAWKSAYELDQIRAANRLAVSAHRAAELAFYDGASELEIHLAYLTSMVAKDSALPYDSIVALNQNAAVLHHSLLSAQRLTNNLSLLIDAGASCAGYAADISRTYSAKGIDDSTTDCRQGLDVFSQLCRMLDTAQQKLVSLVVINADYTDIHVESHRMVAEILANLKIVNCSAEQAFESGLTSVFLPHGIGHLLGVQVHDRGGHAVNIEGDLKLPPAEHPALRCTRTIQTNMVFTIEPGIYFIPQLLEQWAYPELLNQAQIEQLLPFGGARIEDNVVATEGSPENITRDAFELADS